jgi:hypothetical protein
MALAPAQPAAASLGNRAFVHALWSDFLGITPDATTVSYWEGQLDGGLSTRAQVVSSLLTSSSFQRDYIYQTYQLYLDRWTTSAEYTTASTATSSGDFVEVELLALSSADYTDDGGLTNSDFVTKLFDDLLHRAPGGGELTYWTGQLGSWTRKQVAKSILRSAESSANRVEGLTASPCSATQLTGFADVVAGSYCLILKRPASAPDTSYWAPTLSASTGQIPTLWKQLAGSLEYYNSAAVRFPSV